MTNVLRAQGWTVKRKKTRGKRQLLLSAPEEVLHERAALVKAAGNIEAGL